MKLTVTTLLSVLLACHPKCQKPGHTDPLLPKTKRNLSMLNSEII